MALLMMTLGLGAAAVAPVPPACSRQLDAFCALRTGAMAACYKAQHNKTTSMLAAFATADGGHLRAWRCYAPWDLQGPNPASTPLMSRARNVGLNPGDYCSQEEQLEALLLKCDPSWTPPPAPPPPPCPHPCPLDPPPANRSCAATVQWHAGVQARPVHRDIGWFSKGPPKLK